MSPGPATKGSSYRPSRRTAFVVAALSAAIVATQVMLSQEPRASAYRPPTLGEWFFKPHQRNAFLQTPAIGGHLNAVHASGDRVWVGGDGGLLLWSEDGGRTWSRGEVAVAGDSGGAASPSPATSDTSGGDAAVDSAAPYSAPPTSTKAMGPATRSGALQAALAWLAPAPLHAQAQDSSRPAPQQSIQPKGGGVPLPQTQQALPDLTVPGDTGTQEIPGDTATPGAAADSAGRPYAASILTIWFASASVGYAGSDAGDVLRTTDGGRTWQARRLGPYEIVDIRFSNARFGNLIARERSPAGSGVQSQGSTGGVLLLYQTSDGGELWTRQASFPAVEGALSDAGAQVWRTDTLFARVDTMDPGTFALIDLDSRDSAAIADVAFTLGDGYGWAALNGDTSAEVRGRTPSSGWGPLSRTPLPRLRRIFFARELWGWAVAEDGRIFRTEDGGVEWSEGEVPGRFALRDVWFNGVRDRGWAVGEDGTVLRTSDEGKTWEVMAGGDRLHSVSFADARRGWAVGTGGTILRTTNGGRTWKPQRSGTGEALYAVHALSPDTALAVGARATILRTTDGRKWGAVKPNPALIPSLAPPLNRIVSPTPGTVYAGGDFDHFWLGTRDGGAIWDTLTSDEERRIPSGVVGLFTSADTSWSVGPRGSLQVFAADGRGWRTADTTPKPDLYGITGAPDGRLWAVGAGGTILRRDPTGAWLRAAAPGPQRPAPWYYASWAVVLGLLFVGLRPQKPEVITELVEGTLASDRPIQRGEPDPLELGVLAQAVSRFLRNEKTDPPLTLAVTGEWGAGKSSLMNLIRGDLQAWGFRPVWFNAWHHQTEEHLIAAFLENVRAQAIPPLLTLSGLRFRARLLWMRQRKLILLSLLAAGLFAGYLWADPGRAAVVWKGLTTLPREGAGVAEGLRALFPDVAAIVTVLTITGVLARSMQAFGVKPASLLATLSGSARIRDLQAKTSFRHQFAREFEEVTEALRPWDLVVFVDDLDRCRSKQVLDVLEAINFLCTSGRCVIVMGMDMDRVERCVAVQLKDEADAPTADEAEEEEAATVDGAPAAKKRRPDPLRAYARSYLEKLVNIEVPVPQTDVRKAVGLLVPQKDAAEENAEEAAPEQAQQQVERRKKPSRLAAGWEELRPAFPAARWSLALAAAIGLGYSLSQPAPQAPGPAAAPAAGSALTQASAANTGDSVQAAASAQETEVFVAEPARFFPAPEVERWNWPLALGVLLAAGLAGGLVMARPDPTEHDSPRFETALRAWGPYVATHRRTPRAIKKYLNRVRFCAMRQRVPEPTAPWPERVRQRIAGKAERPRYVDDHVPDDVLVAIAALDECEPDALTSDDTFTRFSTFVHETLGEPDANDPADPRRLLQYEDPLPTEYLATYRRLASAVRVDGRKG